MGLSLNDDEGGAYVRNQHDTPSSSSGIVLSDEEDLSDEAVEARHEGVLKNMRDRWALLQRLRLEKKYESLGLPFDWEEGGGQAIGADGEFLTRGGGNGAYSGKHTL
jgi:hypothetical protein